jgi:hypothetical protein
VRQAKVERFWRIVTLNGKCAVLSCDRDGGSGWRMGPWRSGPNAHYEAEQDGIATQLPEWRHNERAKVAP